MGAQGFASRFRYEKIIRTLGVASADNQPKAYMDGHVTQVS